MSLVEIDYKTALMVLGVIIATLNYYYYIGKILKGAVKPHMFSWLIWSLLGAVAFAAQWVENAGPGMWQTAFMTSGTIVVSTMAFFKGDKNYTRSDWIALAFSLLAIPLWLLTKDPLWSVILITIIDIVAMWPTVRKTWIRPHQESALTFFTAGLTCALGVFALSVLNVTTGLYVGTIALANFMFTVMILLRRKKSL